MIIKIKGIKNLNEIEDSVVRNLYGICTEFVGNCTEKFGKSSGMVFTAN